MDLKTMQEFYLAIGKLKRVKRTGWVLREVHDPESVADHSWRMALMALTLPLPATNPDNSPVELNRTKCVFLSLVHDIAECIVGDLIVGRNGLTKPQKHDMEAAAIDSIQSLLSKGLAKDQHTIQDLWLEYELQSSPEARFVKDLDRYDMMLQAFEYEKNKDTSRSLEEFYESTNGKFQFDCIKDLMQQLYSDRKK